jgi:hypothetical protein
MSSVVGTTADNPCASGGSKQKKAVVATLAALSPSAADREEEEEVEDVTMATTKECSIVSPDVSTACEKGEATNSSQSYQQQQNKGGGGMRGCELNGNSVNGPTKEKGASLVSNKLLLASTTPSQSPLVCPVLPSSVPAARSTAALPLPLPTAAATATDGHDHQRAALGPDVDVMCEI